MQNFSLITFINQKKRVSSDFAPIIAHALLKPHSFSKKGAEKISYWYQMLSLKEKQCLYEIKEFKEALSKSSFLCEKIKISSLWVNELFKQVKYPIPRKLIHQLSDSFLFLNIKLPSNVEISVNAERFFKTLIQGINNHPHLIDELKDFLKNASLPLYISPENGDLIKEKFLGLFSGMDNTLYFQADLVSYDTLDTLIHEIGHATDSEKFKPLFEKNSLYIYYDEVRQETKSFLIETKESDSKQGDINPFEDLYLYIRNKLKAKYPSLNEEKIERATAFWFKNEIISIASLSKNQLINVLNIWHLNNIRHTDQIYQKIEYLKKQYTHPSDISHSFKTAAEELKSLFYQHIKKPLFFTRKMLQTTQDFHFFSDKMLEELSNHAGFIEQEENLSSFMLKNCSLKQENNQILLSFNLKQFGPSTILKLQSFYAKRGIYLSIKDKTLYTDKDESIERMTRLIQQFFNKIVLKKEIPVYHFSTGHLPNHKKEEIISFLKTKNIPFRQIENDIFVNRNDLFYKDIIKYSRKAYLIPTPKTKNHPSNLFKIFNALDLTPSLYSQTEDQNNYFLLSEKEFFSYKKSKDLLLSAIDIHQYYYENKRHSKEIFVPNRLYAKKRVLIQLRNEKNFQNQKD